MPVTFVQRWPLAFSVIFTARKRSLEQGNIFTPVCHSVHRGVWSRGVPAPGEVWSWGWSGPGGSGPRGMPALWGVPAPGGGVPAPERSQNTILLASTQAVYKALHSTVREQYQGSTSSEVATVGVGSVRA